MKYMIISYRARYYISDWRFRRSYREWMKVTNWLLRIGCGAVGRTSVLSGVLSLTYDILMNKKSIKYRLFTFIQRTITYVETINIVHFVINSIKACYIQYYYNNYHYLCIIGPYDKISVRILYYISSTTNLRSVSISNDSALGTV